jgi:hypothetical protein
MQPTFLPHFPYLFTIQLGFMENMEESQVE